MTATKHHSTLIAGLTIWAMVLVIISAPSSVFAMSLLTVPLENEFNIPRSTSSSLISFRMTAHILVLGTFAFVFKTKNLKIWIIVGSLLFVAGTYSASYAKAFSFVALTFGSGFGGTGILYGCIQYSIPEYFPNSVSTVTGIVFSGMGSGGILWSLLLENLTASNGWQFALSSIAKYVPLLCLPILLIPAPLQNQNTTEVQTLEQTLEKKFVTADDEKQKHCSIKISKNDKNEGDGKVGTNTKKTTLLQALLTKQIITLAIAYCLFLIAALGIFGHLAAMYQDAGLSSQEAALIVSMVGVAQIIGRPFFGLLADRLLGNRLTLAFCSLHVGISLVCWTYTGTSVEVGIVWALNFGISYGGFWAVMAGAVHENMPDEFFAKAFGILGATVGLPGYIFSSSIFGSLKDITGSYMVPSILGAILLLVSSVVVLLVKSPKKHVDVDEILIVVKATRTACDVKFSSTCIVNFVDGLPDDVTMTTEVEEKQNN